jgi:hypothetical protein
LFRQYWGHSFFPRHRFNFCSVIFIFYSCGEPVESILFFIFFSEQKRGHPFHISVPASCHGVAEGEAGSLGEAGSPVGRSRIAFSPARSVVYPPLHLASLPAIDRFSFYPLRVIGVIRD